MKIKSYAVAALAISLAAGRLLAQDDGPPPGGPDSGMPGTNGPAGPGGHGGHHRPPPSPLMEALDANHDGVISADEIANAPAALKTLDKNGDGQLTKDELQPTHPPQDGTGTNNMPPHRGMGRDGNGKHPPQPVMAALDTNHDGILSADEIANASASLKTLDKNGDGQLTQDELRPPRPPQDGNGPDNGQRPPPPDDNK